MNSWGKVNQVVNYFRVYRGRHNEGVIFFSEEIGGGSTSFIIVQYFFLNLRQCPFYLGAD